MREKDAHFYDDPDSPIPADRRTRFKGLNYYFPDPAYRVRAGLDRYEKPEPIIVATSKGNRQAYLKHGTFTFQLQGAKLRLFVYKSVEDPFARSLFIPFSNETSGRVRYAAGRYLDLEELGGDDYELDFNMAYNPYCAYSEEYTCPLPPAENRLSVRILAGEKNYK